MLPSRTVVDMGRSFGGGYNSFGSESGAYHDYHCHPAQPIAEVKAPDAIEENLEAPNYDTSAEDLELQRALSASAEAYEEEQRRFALEASSQAVNECEWKHAAPSCLTLSGDDRPLQQKDVDDILSPLSPSGRPRTSRPLKKARYAWYSETQNSPEHGPCKDRLSEPEAIRALSFEEAMDLWALLFGPNADEDDIDRWLRSLFSFVRGRDSDEGALSCPWGLRQELGGPCGVLAAVQAYMIREAFWGSSETDLGEALSTASTAASESDTEVPPEPATAQDLAARLAERTDRIGNWTLLASALARMLYISTPASHYVWAEVADRHTILIHEFSTAQGLAEWLQSTATIEVAPSPVLSFVCSLILTRGLANIRADMDDPSASLVGVFGHCSQELVNLCLTGKCVTNIFDGTVTFEDDGDVLNLRGIQEQPEIGFLSALEPLKLCEVGSLFKRPRYPLWIIGTSTHYSLLFSRDSRASVLPDPQECIQAENISLPLLHFNGKDFGVERPTLRTVDLTLLATEAQAPEYVVLSGDHDKRLFGELLRTRWPRCEVSYSQDGLGDLSQEGPEPPRIM